MTPARRDLRMYIRLRRLIEDTLGVLAYFRPPTLPLGFTSRFMKRSAEVALKVRRFGLLSNRVPIKTLVKVTFSIEIRR
jgi:hypothetical protein